MPATDQASAEKTYRAIGRFVFEFSQVEYTIRYHLAEEIELDEEHFSTIVESYDTGLLCTVAIEVFKKSRVQNNAARIEELINNFRELTPTGTASHMDSGCRVERAGWCTTCHAAT